MKDLPPCDGVGAAHELQLAAGAADVAVAGGLRGRLALQVDLRRVVDRHDLVVLHDVVRQVGVVDRAAQDVRVAVDHVVEAARAEREGEDDLAGVERLARAGDEAGVEQVDQAVDQHLGVDAEVPDAAFRQQGADRVRHAADADLQAGAVLDLGGDEARDRAVDLGGRGVGQLGDAAASSPSMT